MINKNINHLHTKEGKEGKKNKRNVLSTTFLQQILSDRLLLAITNGQKSNFNNKFKFERIKTYHLRFLVKML